MQDLCVHLQMAHRCWQRGKKDMFKGEIATAYDLVRGFISGDDTSIIQENLQKVEQAAQQENGAEVALGLSRALGRAERMIRLGKY